MNVRRFTLFFFVFVCLERLLINAFVKNSHREDCIREGLDALALYIPISHANESSNNIATKFLCVYYSELFDWKSKVRGFVKAFNELENTTINDQHLEEITQYAQNILISMGYPQDVVNGNGNSTLPAEMNERPITSKVAVNTITQVSYESTLGKDVPLKPNFRQIRHDDVAQLQSEKPISGIYNGLNPTILSASHSYAYHVATRIADDILFVNNKKISSLIGRKANPVSLIGNVMQRKKLNELKTKSKNNSDDKIDDSLNPIKLRVRPLFIIFQTRFVNTGGTAALNILYEHLIRSGARALLCNEANHASVECSTVPPYAIAISGEWCHEVLQDYKVEQHKGRGIQYHLGFHPAGDVCHGHIAMAVSQYLSSYLHNRILSAYYLGGPMTSTILETFEDLLSDGESNEIAKENLVIIDPDIRDYPPLHAEIHFEVPEHARYVLAKGFAHDEMPLLLQRAKVTLDLALPGAERLSGEGALLGAIPIISSRWNGASGEDFPGVLRVDMHNGTAITEMINYALTNYHDIIRTSRHAQFQTYMLSMSERLSNTLDVVISSASLKFVLKANNLEEETTASFMAAALLHLFPLAAIDIYVPDAAWFKTHHYPFVNLMVEGGTMRSNAIRTPPSGFQALHDGSQVTILSHQDWAAASTSQSLDDNIFSSSYNVASTTVLLSVNAESLHVFANAQVLNDLTKKQRHSKALSEMTDVTLLYACSNRLSPCDNFEENDFLSFNDAESWPFAMIFPQIMGNENDAIVGNFLSLCRSFFGTDSQRKQLRVLHRNDVLSLGYQHIALSLASLRTLDDLRVCRKECDLDVCSRNVLRTSEMNVIDGIKETASWLTLDSYYCNLVLD